MRKTPLERAIDILGSQAALARALSTGRSRVHNWLNRDIRIAPEVAIAIEQATGGKVKRSELRPDFPWSA